MPFGGVDWALMYHQPRASAFAVQKTVVDNLLVLVGVGLGGLLIVGVLVARDTVPALTTLRDSAIAIEAGDPDVDNGSARIDEFGQLFDSVDAMRNSLRAGLEEADEERERAENAQRHAQQLADHLETKATQFSDAMARTAEGELTVRMNADSEWNAMSEIAESFNEMVTELRHVFASVKTFADRVDDSTDEVSASSEEVKAASGEVSEKIQGIVDRTATQKDHVDRASDEMTELSTTIEEVASSTDDIAVKSDRAVEEGTAGTDKAEEAVTREQHGALRVRDPRRDRVDPEAREDRNRNGADLEASIEDRRDLGDHRHVQADGVAHADADRVEVVRHAVGPAVEVVVGDGARLAGFALPDDRGVVAGTVLDVGVAVEQVVRDVQLAAGVPVRELRAVGVVAHGVVVLVELQAEVVDHLVPEPLDAGVGLAVDLGRGALDQLLVGVDVVRPHELADVGGVGESLGGAVSDVVGSVQCCHPDDCDRSNSALDPVGTSDKREGCDTT